MTPGNVKVINTSKFYSRFHGHPSKDLERLVEHVRPRPVIWLVGDSSLDNKYWIRDGWCAAVNGYESILSPPKCIPDVAYHMNRLVVDSQLDMIVINAAVEESTLGERATKFALPQDAVVHSHLCDGDVIVVSVGGNDIALRPSLGIVWNMLKMLKLNSEAALREGPTKAWGMSYFVEMFRDRLSEYLIMLMGDKRPALLVLCMIYFPDEQSTESWANFALGTLGYDSHPAKLQEAIRQVYQHAMANVQEIQGVPVVSVPLYQVLDGKNSSDYVARVEPSNKGGQSMATLLWNTISDALTKKLSPTL